MNYIKLGKMFPLPLYRIITKTSHFAQISAVIFLVK